MLAGFPNVFSNQALKLAHGPLSSLAERADVALVREPWQVDAVNDLLDVPVVYSSHNVEAERFDELRGTGGISEWAYDRVVTIEERALDAASLVVCTSERDAETYQNRFGYDGDVHIAPNATYEETIREHEPDSVAATQFREEHEVEDSFIATFVGSNHPPNVEAVEAILGTASDFPGKVVVLIAGSVCDAVESTNDSVRLLGFVDDLEPLFDATDVALNPMVSGGGTNIKVLDYFARSLPVLSTPFGARGIDAVPGEDIVIATIDRFPEKLEELAENPERHRLGRNARELVSGTYTWKAVSEGLYEVLDEYSE